MEWFNESTTTFAGFEATALRIEEVSIGQVEILNSERRRKALVSNCACMRLESAMRTEIPSEGADGGFIKRDPPNETSGVLILGCRSTVLKDTCHIIRVRLSNRDESQRCCGKHRERLRIFDFSLARKRNTEMMRLCFPSKLPHSGEKCDSVNIQVYFCR
jgi:hypothetical protein